MSTDEGTPSSQQVDQILGSSKLAVALESDRYKHLLDHVPVAVAVSRGSGAAQHVVYANKAFETLMAMARADVEGQSWTCLDGFLNEDNQTQTLGAAIRDGEDFIGVFRPVGPVDRLVIVQAYASVIESDNGIENFRIAALVDVGGRERAQIERFESQIRDRDMLMRELQHRVKNNLQLITALVRMEARSAAEGETVALGRLASRIDALTVLYRILSAEDALAEIDLGQYLSDVATAVMEANAASDIEIELETGYCPMSINVAMPAGLLVNEMLTNALKYAFVGRSAGKLKLICKLEQGRFTIIVSDDGVGLGEHQEWPSPRKLGALILQTLKENARNVVFRVETIRGQGTWFTLTFDAAQPPVN
ncbi:MULTISPECIES: histidine kinase dimerization/phosphoacceptor domain -containing protein [Rhodopseudomonas]|uniref:histidine kinase n=1 Tax=Rhodopseudomonas palustris TaxID=1076 RepID=A0A0D7EEI4_RHOPL|nr:MULTISPECIES: histidine kinase dimerization/phosphoacceptor domain -containing protein [Rhodopseudomonas]KIZ39189.1 histidine kinase [Rhodopseudomonas palustris]MDF3810390.1 histidine kinase dimerization/phosphoacceptor domain -containing protein [Rhodopseudomonas sp. BAL398]WOK19316.1 histidine kinase dimerization/phosphoacceptor domain -containing protein [Rhodopseudomonas sp. BAL398]